MIGVVLINTIFIRPYFELNFFLVGCDRSRFSRLLMIAIVTGALTGRNKKQMLEVSQREKIVQNTAEFSRNLIATSGYEDTIQLILEYLNHQLESRIVYIRDKQGLSAQQVSCHGRD